MERAAGLGDIGEHFTDTDEKFKDADSIELLKEVRKILDKAGMDIVNVDAVVILEKPKISDKKGEMRENIANALKLSCKDVNIKATTTEKLGFIGRSEGIASEAVVTLVKRSEL